MAEKTISRTYSILMELMSRNIYISIGALSKKYNCSERTIRSEINYIKDLLSQYCLELTHKKNLGYIIINHSHQDITIIKEKIIEEWNAVPSNFSERIYYILKKILLAEEYLTVEEISDELFISKVSVTQCLRRVREILSSYHLLLENKPHYGLRLQGAEKDIRKCIIEHGIDINQFHLWNSKEYSNIQSLNFFKKINLAKINNLIKKEINDAGIVFYDMFYNNLIIHIAVAIKRIYENSYIEDFDMQLDHSYVNEMKVAYNIAKIMSQEFQLVFPKSEINYIAMHLIGNRVAVIDEDKLFLDETYILVNQMLLHASKEFDIDFISDDILKKDLYIHIKSALNRICLGIQLHNPMIQQLKDNFPFPFEIAINACYNKDINLYQLKEEELGYIVIHFAAALERIKEKSSFKRKILIFCASGIGTVRLLEAKLRNEFKNYIEMTTLYDISHLSRIQNDYDLILSTIPIDHIDNHALCVSPIPTNEDISNINKTLFKKTRKHNYEIQEVFHQELFCIQKEPQTKSAILKQISEDLLRLGYVDEYFYDGLLKREAIVDTAIGNMFAIPHPLKNIALKNGIYVYILKEPIQWANEKMVSVIFTLVIKRSEAKYFEKIYELIADIASDIENVYKIIDSHHFTEVINILDKLMKDE